MAKARERSEGACAMQWLAKTRRSQILPSTLVPAGPPRRGRTVPPVRLGAPAGPIVKPADARICAT